MTHALHHLAIVALAATLVAGCSSRPDPPPAEPPPPAPETPAAALAAQRWLAEQLDIPLADVAIISSEAREWSDGCLGLGGPAESCLAVMTPGWLVMLEAGGTRYEVRTDDTGQQIRSPQFPAQPTGPPGDS